MRHEVFGAHRAPEPLADRGERRSDGEMAASLGQPRQPAYAQHGTGPGAASRIALPQVQIVEHHGPAPQAGLGIHRWAAARTTQQLCKRAAGAHETQPEAQA